MIRVDFHSHTNQSRDAINIPRNYLKRYKALNVIPVVTDHNSTGAWKELETARKELKHDFIRGEEIYIKKNGTIVGEICASFMNAEIQPGTWMEIVDQLRSQDAFIAISHPFDRFRHSCEQLEELWNNVDAVEIFNARCWRAKYNDLAKEFIEERKIAFTVASDAHMPEEIGNAWMELPCDSIEGVRKELKKKSGKVVGKYSGLMPHLKTQLAKRDLIADA